MAVQVKGRRLRQWYSCLYTCEHTQRPNVPGSMVACDFECDTQRQRRRTYPDFSDSTGSTIAEGNLCEMAKGSTQILGFQSHTICRPQPATRWSSFGPESWSARPYHSENGAVEVPRLRTIFEIHTRTSQTFTRPLNEFTRHSVRSCVAHFIGNFPYFPTHMNASEGFRPPGVA